MRRLFTAVLAAACFTVVGLGLMTLMAPTTEAVGCPTGGPVSNIFCGGIAGIECPGKLVCIDDPRDNCCPQTGGADCGGVCVSPNRLR